jgi:hypothetical protein
MRKNPFSTGVPAVLGALLSVSSLLMVGCNGGGAGDSAPVMAPARPLVSVRASPVGFWRGTLTSTNPAGAARAVAIVSSAKDIRVISEAGFHYVTGAGSTFLGTGHAPAGRTFPDGSSKAAMTEKGSFLDAQAGSDGSDVDTYTFTCRVGGDNLRFVSSAPDPAHDSPLTLADLSGTYTSLASDNSLVQPLTLVLADGAGTVATAGGDRFAVTFTIPDPGRSAVSLSLTCTPDSLEVENPVPGTGCCTPSQGGRARVLTFGAAGGTRSFCGTFTRN